MELDTSHASIQSKEDENDPDLRDLRDSKLFMANSFELKFTPGCRNTY